MNDGDENLKFRNRAMSIERRERNKEEGCDGGLKDSVSSILPLSLGRA